MAEARRRRGDRSKGASPSPPNLGEMGPDETGSDVSARGISVGAGSVGDESQTRAPKKSKQAARAGNPNYSKSAASSARAAGRSRAASGESGKSRVASRALAACGTSESEESRPGGGPGIPTVDMEGGEAAPATPVPVPAQRSASHARSIRFDAGAAAAVALWLELELPAAAGRPLPTRPLVIGSPPTASTHLYWVPRESVITGSPVSITDHSPYHVSGILTL